MPKKGWWKLNVDGAIFPAQCRAGVGCVICDELGKFTMAATLPEVHRDDSLEMELLAMLRGLHLCWMSDLGKLVVETNLVAVQMMEEGPKAHAKHTYLLQEIWTLASFFEMCNFSYVSHLGNHVAHSLAHHAWNMVSTTVWWDIPPPYIGSSL